MKTARTTLLALAMTGALGFGATAAMADARPCPLTAIGTCGNLAKCQEACFAAGGRPADATCTNGCCFCPGAGV
ncbi:MAG TPA: hypothetical protein VGX50_11825 [Longimicrobium sp.]|jgi:hypothetical protein|nr:hypothetical protein [Longimicrobium sp.]